MSYNSTIEKKRCKHKGCFNMPKMSAGGFCWEHESEDIAYKRKQARLKDKAALRKITNTNNFVDNKAAKEFQELQNWYADKAKIIALLPTCDNCGSYIPPKYYRAATAHIIPKSIFKSVQTHTNNYLILGAHCCHDKTHRMDTFSKMACFTEAVKRFRTFEHLITEKHALLDEFLKYANKL